MSELPAERILGLSAPARHLWFVADKARHPRLGVVIFGKLVSEFGLGEDLLWTCFEELCEAQVVPAQGISTVIPFEGERAHVGRLNGPAWARLRAQVFVRDEFTCRYCGARPSHLHCDHVVPVVRGGSNDIDNLVAACGPCNQSKHDKLLSEWRP